jgi:hypothetical protein
MNLCLTMMTRSKQLEDSEDIAFSSIARPTLLLYLSSYYYCYREDGPNQWNSGACFDRDNLRFTTLLRTRTNDATIIGSLIISKDAATYGNGSLLERRR